MSPLRERFSHESSGRKLPLHVSKKSLIQRYIACDERAYRTASNGSYKPMICSKRPAIVSPPHITGVNYFLHDAAQTLPKGIHLPQQQPVTLNLNSQELYNTAMIEFNQLAVQQQDVLAEEKKHMSLEKKRRSQVGPQQDVSFYQLPVERNQSAMSSNAPQERKKQGTTFRIKTQPKILYNTSQEEEEKRSRHRAEAD